VPGQGGLSRPGCQMASASTPQQSKAADGTVSQLICRIRPCDKPSPLVSVSEEEARIEGIPEKGHPGEPLQFHHVLNSRGPGEQEALFEYIRPSVLASIRGQSCTVVAYGGNQSGKSYALAGFFTHTRLHGLAPRAIQFVSEVRDNDPEGMPIVEASFFELQNDCICDLVPSSCPRVLVKESSQPPYVLLDERLTVQRCDGSNGYNRLLETYFTGIEHKRKSAHTCFQLCFINGENRAYLRFVEMAWPRSQVAPGPLGGASAASNASTGSLAPAHAPSHGKPSTSTPPVPPQGRACAALEQVLQCKLAGTMPVPYRSSPLALLLKPCFEGTSLLTFIYCLRLEHTHLPNLTLAAPLLIKLHQWMSQSKLPRGKARVPPLQLHATCQGSSVQAPPGPPPGKPIIGVDISGDTSAMSSSGSSNGGRSGQAAPAAPLGQSMPAPGLGLSGSMQAPVQPLNMALPLQGMEHVVEPVAVHAQDARMIQDCALLLEMKRRSFETLRADVMRSAAVLDNVNTMLDKLRASREAIWPSGPSEKETTLKLLYEQVSRSQQRTEEEMTKMYDDIEALSQFCDAGSFPPIYDSYNATEENVQKILDYAAAQAHAHAVHHGEIGHHDGLDASAAGNVLQAGLRVDGAVVIPQLPLGLLPQAQEVPRELQQGGGAANMDDSRDQLSPSSMSSCSDHTMSRPMPLQVNTPATPAPPHLPLTLNLATQSPAGIASRQLSDATPLVSLPHTPPLPAGQRTIVGAMAWQNPAALQGFHVWPTAPQHINVQPDQEISGEVLTVEGVSSAPFAEVRAPPLVVPPQSPELNRSASAWNLPTRATIQQLPPDVIDPLDGQGMRKSHSTSSVQRALGVVPLLGGPNARPAVAVAASAAPPQAYASPLPGHRATLGAASPCAQMVISKQGVAAAAPRPGPPRPNVGRQATPAPQTVKSEEVRVRGSQGRTTHSPSPVMLRRSISTQALRVERNLTGSKPHTMAKQPSPERQRPPTAQGSSGVVSASPMRTAWAVAPRRTD